MSREPAPTPRASAAAWPKRLGHVLPRRSSAVIAGCVVWVLALVAVGAGLVANARKGSPASAGQFGVVAAMAVLGGGLNAWSILRYHRR